MIWIHDVNFPDAGLNFLKLTSIRVLKCLSLPSCPPPTRANGNERLIGLRWMWTCLEIVLWGWFQLSLSGVQFTWVNSRSSIHSQTPFENQQWQVNPEETKRLCQSARVHTEAARSHSSTTKRSLAYFPLPSYYKHSSAKKARRTKTTASSTVCWDSLTPFPNTMCPLKPLLLQNITYPFSRQFQKKKNKNKNKKPRVCSQQNILPRVCFSKTSSHKTGSRKISYDATESPKKPEISTSPRESIKTITLNKQKQNIASHEMQKLATVSLKAITFLLINQYIALLCCVSA